jgi:hypothetical protein
MNPRPSGYNVKMNTLINFTISNIILALDEHMVYWFTGSQLDQNIYMLITSEKNIVIGSTKHLATLSSIVTNHVLLRALISSNIICWRSASKAGTVLYTRSFK